MFNFNFQHNDARRVIKSSSYSMKDPNRKGAVKIQSSSGYKKVQPPAARTSATRPTYSFSGSSPVSAIYGVVVCVNYSDYFEHCLASCNDLFDKLYVVTDNKDTKTADLCSQYHFVELIKTDAFYKNGSSFDKAEGINAGLSRIPQKKSNWVLIFDADIVFPDYSRKYLTSKSLEATVLFGAPRHFIRNYDEYIELRDSKASFSAVTDCYDPLDTPIGYFQLFNSLNLTRKNIRHGYPTGSGDCSTSDLLFARKFPKRTTLRNIRVIHLGIDGVNWSGRCSPTFEATRKCTRTKLAAFCSTILRGMVCKPIASTILSDYNSRTRGIQDWEVMADTLKSHLKESNMPVLSHNRLLLFVNNTLNVSKLSKLFKALPPVITEVHVLSTKPWTHQECRSYLDASGKSISYNVLDDFNDDLLLHWISSGFSAYFGYSEFTNLCKTFSTLLGGLVYSVTSESFCTFDGTDTEVNTSQGPFDLLETSHYTRLPSGINYLEPYSKYWWLATPGYRLADMIIHEDRWQTSEDPDGTIEGLSYHKEQYADTTLVNRYFSVTNVVRDYDVLQQEVDLTKHLFEGLPGDDTLVIHLRLGDVIEDSPYTVEQHLAESLEHHGGVGHYYVKPLSYFEDIVKASNAYGIKKVILVGDTTHQCYVPSSDKYVANRSDAKSLEYATKVLDYFSKQNLDISCYINGNPDYWFSFLCSSKYFAPSGGGYSLLAGAMSSMSGGIVYDPAAKSFTDSFSVEMDFLKVFTNR